MYAQKGRDSAGFCGGGWKMPEQRPTTSLACSRLGRIRGDSTVSYRKASGSGELGALVADDLTVPLTERFTESTASSAPAAVETVAGEGQTDRAGRLFSAAARLSSPDDRPLNDTRGVDPDRTVAAARTASDDVTFKGGWSAGEALTEEEAIALALQDEGSAVSQ